MSSFLVLLLLGQGGLRREFLGPQGIGPQGIRSLSRCATPAQEIFSEVRPFGGWSTPLDGEPNGVTQAITGADIKVVPQLLDDCVEG